MSYKEHLQPWPGALANVKKHPSNESFQHLRCSQPHNEKSSKHHATYIKAWIANWQSMARYKFIQEIALRQDRRPL